ncbi:MAG: permease-like cell division protein FtsX [Bacteroidales bacterium]|jgi:cell division transport system permease protein|nr:permease-like cell division protein FtsX [Bacteroidales bacterium]
MNKKYGNHSPVSLWSANFSTVLSISLVLFMLGFIMLFIFHAYEASRDLKEQVSFTVYLNLGSSDLDAKDLEKEIRRENIVKSTQYISAEEARVEMDKLMGEEHLAVLDSVNPYQASIVVNLKAEALDISHIKRFINKVEAKDIVEMVDYRHELISNINSMIYNVSVVTAIFFLALLFISITLINHTIRLSIYSKRFVIRTMELVGAKGSLIRKPFLLKGLIFGLIGGLVACMLLTGLLWWITTSFDGIIKAEYYIVYAKIGAVVWLFGIVLSFVCSAISVFSYMNMRTEKLYK